MNKCDCSGLGLLTLEMYRLKCTDFNQIPLTRKEEQDVPGRFPQVDLHDRDQRGVQVVGLWLFRVQNLHRECAARNREYRSLEEVLGELDGV